MSTLVQIKRSTSNAAPATLEEGELAYSYVSNVIFIGDTANGVMNIGGQYYTDLIDNASAANGASTFVRRYANGSAQFGQLDILTAPTANNHVATKEYVDTAIIENIALNDLSDVIVPGVAGDQNNRILIGHSNGEYIATDVTGNVTLSNTGVFTIGSDQVTNAMLVNDDLTVTAGNGLAGGGLVALGGSITLDVVAGDGISNTGDAIAVDSTVVRTEGTQTLNGFYTFSNTATFNAGINVTGNINLNGNTTYINVTTLNITDPLIYLASNNDVSDIVDIGFVGGHNTAGVYQHSGLVRHAADGNWYLFTGLQDEGHENNVVDIANTSYALLRANLDAQSANVDSLTVDSSLLVTGAANVVGGDLTVLNGNIHADGTGNLFNMTTSVINIGDVATTVNIGGGLGNTVIKNTLIASQNVNVLGNVDVIGALTLGSPLAVSSGGLGLTSLTANGVFYGDTTSTVGFATGTDGQVLQISSGVPTFAMLDGGSF